MRSENTKKGFSLMALPNYTYPLNRACPTCFAPLTSLKTRDGRCDACRHDKKLLPVNYVRVKRRSYEDEDEAPRDDDED